MEWLTRRSEHGLFKRLHTVWEEAGKTVELPIGRPLLVFQHVPRTAGDSMRTHLFHDAKVDSAGVRQYQLEERPNGYLTPKDEEIANDPQTKLIKGYFSKQELARLTRKKAVFLFLREPFERIASWVGLIKPTAGGKLLTPSEAVQLQHVHPCTFIQNAVTWQLGDQQNCLLRNSTLTNTELLEKAKDSLQAADFVGFYETLDTDFWSLKQQLFPEVYHRAGSVVPLAFWFGTVLALPRIRVTKYAALWGESEVMKVRAVNHLDVKLFEWAWAKFRPGVKLYPSYTAFMQDNALQVMLVSVIIMLPCALCLHLMHQLHVASQVQVGRSPTTPTIETLLNNYE